MTVSTLPCQAASSAYTIEGDVMCTCNCSTLSPIVCLMTNGAGVTWKQEMGQRKLLGSVYGRFKELM